MWQRLNSFVWNYVLRYKSFLPPFIFREHDFRYVNHIHKYLNCPFQNNELINLVSEESYKITGLLLQFCNLSGAGFTEQDIIFSSSVLATHAVSVGENGRGFYPVFAFMSHSCTYNARHVIDECNCIRVYSQTQIKQECF